MKRVIREWDEAAKMPPLKFILDRVRDENNRPQLINDARRILERGDKPPDWEPMTTEQIADLHEQIRKAANLRVIPGYRPREERDGAA